MIADQNCNDICFAIIYPTASATVYGRRPKFFMAKHLATAEGENRAYGPTPLFWAVGAAEKKNPNCHVANFWGGFFMFSSVEIINF